MRNKRIIAMLMTVFLLTSTLVSAAGSEAGDENTANLPEVPEVIVVGNNVNGAGEFLEVSLRVNGWRFQSVGVVLSYDTGVLTPVDWNDPTQPLTPKESWTTVVPTKGTDLLSGKPALVTVAASEDSPSETEEGEDSLPETPSRAYLYLGADALQAMDLEHERVVTVRFAITEGKTVTLPQTGHETEESNTLCLAANESILDTSIPGMPLITTTLDQDGLPVEHPYHKVISADETETLYTVQFESEAGPSVNTGTTVSGGGKAITFFDWDGRAIDAVSADDGNAAAVIEAWEDAHEDRLTNKPGYAFDCWLVVYENNDGKGLVTKNETFTSNDEKLDRTNPDISEDIAKPSELFKDGNSVFLQAAYYAKTTANGFTDDLVNGGKTDNTDRYYTISEPVYTRYGAADAVAGSYSLTMTVTRLQEDGNTGVTRLREPAIWVAMTPAGGGANIMNLIRLENTDTTTFEVVTTKQIASVTYKVIDVYGISNWPGCADRSDVTKGARNRNTCITLGTQGYLAEQAYNVYQGGTWESTVNNWAFADCYYNNGTQSGKAAATWWNDTRCNTAKSRLLTATQAKGAKLTYAEVVTALNGVT